MIRLNVNIEKLRKFTIKPRKLRAQWTVEDKESSLYAAFYSENYSEHYVDRKLPDKTHHYFDSTKRSN